MLKLSIFICIIAQFLINCPAVFCNGDDDTSSIKGDINTGTELDSTNYDQSSERINENDSEQIENFIDPHSLYYDRRSKKVLGNVESLQTKQNDGPSQGCPTLRKNSEDCDTLKVYYKRLVLMLLSNANLKTKDDLVDGQLFVKGTRSQIETLRKFETENYSIKEIDLILSEIIFESSYYNYAFHVPNSSEIIQYLPNFMDLYVEAIIIACSVLAVVILSRIMTVYRAIFVILIMLFTVSFYMTWCHLIQQAEIKLATAQVKYIEMPATCKPHNMNMWDKVKLFFFDDKECEKYIEAKMMNPKLQITPALVLSHLFATVTLHPIAHVGEAISKFVNNATAHLNPWLQLPAQILLYLCLPALFMVLVFALRGGSVNLGLGPLFFAFATHGNSSIPNADKRQTIELIREVLAEVPASTLPSVIETNKSVPLSITNSKPEDNSSIDNLCKDQCTKLISNETQKEISRASGDSIKNDLLSEESKETSKEYIESVKNNLTKHIGSGDA